MNLYIYRQNFWFNNWHQTILLNFQAIIFSFIKAKMFKTATCWQILAYLANTFAFSMIDKLLGSSLPIFRVHLHLAKSAPSALYFLHLSANPSKPWVVVSPSVPAKFTVPLDTLSKKLSSKIPQNWVTDEKG